MSDADVMTREAAVDHGGSSGPGGETADDARQFVIFHVKDGMFAVPLAEVKEIIRMPDVVRMPMSPAALEGLANLRGTVLPVINVRSIFGFEQVSHNDATRVVVLDQGHPVGLVVDRMANVVTVEAEDIESADTIQSTVDTNLLTGMIKGRDGASMVMILDAANTIKRQFSDLGGRPRDNAGTTLAGQHMEATARAASTASAIEENQLVSFDVAGQEYAFPIEEVQEIVQLPDHVTAVPNTAAHVLGVITLRNRLLPLVSLRQMFGLPAAERERCQQGGGGLAGRRHRGLRRRGDGQHQGSPARRSLGHRGSACSAGAESLAQRYPVDLPAGRRKAPRLHPVCRSDVQRSGSAQADGRRERRKLGDGERRQDCGRGERDRR